MTCNFVGGCKINNGGCHPLALCTESSFSGVTCRCHIGFIGDGITSCLPDPATLVTPEVCKNNPCVHGTCVPGLGNTFVCDCQPGYTGLSGNHHWNTQLKTCTLVNKNLPNIKLF